MPNATTIRSLARNLSLSRSTVSNALRNVGRVSPATVQRVQKAAREAAYRHNPLAASLMSELRRSRGGTFRGVLAAIDLDEPDRSPHGDFHVALVRGATARARELGFKLEQFIVDRTGLTLPRLDSILQSRGIHGLLLPSWAAPDFSALDWSRYCGVYTDYNLVQPELHSFCSDHYRSTVLTLERLHAKGYRRPGLVIDHGRNERLHRRHSSAVRSYSGDHAEAGSVVPPLIIPELSQPVFARWFRRHRPDVVLCHASEVMDWMEACGAKIPATHGFVSLNLANETRPCAGLNLQPHEIGARGIEFVIAQLHRNERGTPASPTRTTIRSRWVDGPTVRSAPAPARNKNDR